MALSVNIGGIYKNIDKGTVNIGGIWKDIISIFTNIGGVWKEGWIAFKGIWTTSTNMLSTILVGAAGTQDAAIVAGEGAAEQFNGASWASVANPVYWRTEGYIVGSQSAAYDMDGYSSNFVKTTQSWNGASWATMPDAVQPRAVLTAVGTLAVAMSMGGNGSGRLASCEYWNGTAWSTMAAQLPSARCNLGSSGTPLAAMSTGGENNSVGYSECILWNGTSWATGNSTLLGRYAFCQFGTQDSAIIAGGDTTGTGGGFGTSTSEAELYKNSVWSVTGAMNWVKNGNRGCGSFNKGMECSGYANGGTNKLPYTEKLN